MKNQHFPCLDCGVSLAKDWPVAKPTCHEQKHKTTDLAEDVEDFNDWLVEWETDAHQRRGVS